MSESEWPELTGDSQEIWEQNASFWDGHMGEGNDFQRLLINPATLRLLALQAGEAVLEVACGNGSFARQMAHLGARVTAFDFSPTFIQRARERSAGLPEAIEYHVIDAARPEQLLALGERRFGAAVSNMALMDMAEIDPLLECLARLLVPGGRFVFSVMHPCFNSLGVTKIVEEEDRDGELVRQYALKVLSYLTPSNRKGLGVIGQPRPHHYFHRPLSVLFERCFRAGFALDGLEEPAFPPSHQPNRPLSWENFFEIPPALVARMRLVA